MPSGIYPHKKGYHRPYYGGGFQKGHPSYHTEKSKKKISETLKRKGIKPPQSVPWNKRIKVDRIKYPNMGHFQSHSEEAKRKIGFFHKGRKNTEEMKKRMSEYMKAYPGKWQFRAGQLGWWHGKKRPEISGENHYNWKGDKRKIKNERNDPAYKFWVHSVKKRDKECKLKDNQCDGYLIVHHIKSWSKHSELRYELLNGITLCQFHHPIKKDDEQRLIPIFEELVGSK